MDAGVVDPETVNIEYVATDRAEAWIGYFAGEKPVDYCYGGTRLTPVAESDAAVTASLQRLMGEESRLKNALINLALAEVDWSDSRAHLPQGFLASTVSGARCLIRPRTQGDFDILSDPQHPAFRPAIDGIFAEVGAVLNRLGGMVKLTPDFGRFADCSDLLHRFTPHVLGIGRDRGGCGGKSTYSSTGILEGLEVFGLVDRDHRYVLIGSAGALGVDVDMFLRSRGFVVTGLCDLQYDAGEALPPPTYPLLPAEVGRFTDQTLGAGNVVIATTWGRELENSNLQALQPGTALVLAHNLCLPAGEAGQALVDALYSREILILPGQLLTLGGALTSRIEWFSRQDPRFATFNKPLAHYVVRKVIRHLATRVKAEAEAQTQSPAQALHTLGAEAEALVR